MRVGEPSPEEFYVRSVRASVAVGLLGALFAAVYAPSGPSVAGIYLAFLGWALANLALWRVSLRELLGRRRAFILLPVLTAKVLWLAILLLLCHAFAIGENRGIFLAFLLGFNTPFLVMLLKAGGRALSRESAASAAERAKEPSEPSDGNVLVDK